MNYKTIGRIKRQIIYSISNNCTILNVFNFFDEIRLASNCLIIIKHNKVYCNIKYMNKS